jgi:hypothetical protein
MLFQKIFTRNQIAIARITSANKTATRVKKNSQGIAPSFFF